MSKLIPFTEFRIGKTFLWSNNFTYQTSNKQNILNKNLTLSIGLSQYINQLLQFQKFYGIVSKMSNKITNSSLKLTTFVYPRLVNNFFKPNKIQEGNHNIVKKREVISYVTIIKGVRQKVRINSYKLDTNSILQVLYDYLQLKEEQKIRTKNKKKKKKFISLNAWLKKHMFREIDTKKLISLKNYWKLLNQKIGVRVKINFINIFYYLRKKYGFNGWNQDYLFHEKYRRYRWKNQSYFDIINFFCIFSLIKNTEQQLLQILSFAMIRLHLQNIKIKLFFYFITALVQNMSIIKRSFHALKIIISGKSKGGKARTSQLKTYVGIYSVQALKDSLMYNQANFRTNYGEFGITIIGLRRKFLNIRDIKKISRV